MFPEPTEIEVVYSYLLAKFMNATRDNDEPLRARIDAAIMLFEELWPDDTALWKKRDPGEAAK